MVRSSRGLGRRGLGRRGFHSMGASEGLRGKRHVLTPVTVYMDGWSSGAALSGRTVIDHPWWTKGLEGKDTSVLGYVDGEPLTAAHYNWDTLHVEADTWPEGRVFVDNEGFMLGDYATSDAQIRQWMTEYKIYIDALKVFRPDCPIAAWHVPIHMGGIYQSAYPGGASCVKWLARHEFDEMGELYGSLDWVMPVCYPYHADLAISAVFTVDVLIEMAKKLGSLPIYPIFCNWQRYVFAPRDSEDPYSGCLPTQPDGSPWKLDAAIEVPDAGFQKLLVAIRMNANGGVYWGYWKPYVVNGYTRRVNQVFG